MPSAADVLKVQLRHSWLEARRVLDGLTEDEYLWEPVSPCWSVRRRGTSVRGWGSGEFVCEDSWPPPDPLPTTTIAWRSERETSQRSMGLLADVELGAVELGGADSDDLDALCQAATHDQRPPGIIR